MPFRETCATEERISMSIEYDSGSCETFCVWRVRRACGDPDWLKDDSHEPDTERRSLRHGAGFRILGPSFCRFWRGEVAGGHDDRRHFGPGGPGL